MRDLEACYREANFGDTADNNAHDLSYEEFAGLLRLIAVTAGNKDPALSAKSQSSKWLHLMNFLKVSGGEGGPRY